jgi:hypothetical protein
MYATSRSQKQHPISGQELLSLLPKIRLTTADQHDPAILGSSYRTIPAKLMEILASVLSLHTELFSDTMTHSAHLPTWLSDGAPEGALGATPTNQPWDGLYVFLNLWMPHLPTTAAWLCSVYERLHSALQSELPTRVVWVRPCNDTPPPFLSAYETVIGLVPEHALVTAPHMSPSCPNAAACCLCKTSHEIVLIQNQLADALDKVDWKELKARLENWSLTSNCAAMPVCSPVSP